MGCFSGLPPAPGSRSRTPTQNRALRQPGARSVVGNNRYTATARRNTRVPHPALTPIPARPRARRPHGTGHHGRPATPVQEGSAGPIGSPRRRFHGFLTSCPARWHQKPGKCTLCRASPDVNTMAITNRQQRRTSSGRAGHGPSSGRGRPGRGNVRAGPLARSACSLGVSSGSSRWRFTSSTPDGRPAPARRVQRVAAIAVTRVDRA